MDLSTPKIIGILNITPDSFYKDSRFNPNEDSFLEKAKQMYQEGVDIIDIGGFSTRPGAENVDLETELKRVIPAIKKIKLNLPNIIISIDTFRSEVAEKAINYGANIINDVSAGEFDSQMIPIAIKLNVPYILMHSRSEENNIHKKSSYKNVVREVFSELITKANLLQQSGLKDIILDPGFGFSKDLNENFEMLKYLNSFCNEKFPLLIGISRKSMIYKYLNITPEESLSPTTSLHLKALNNGAKFLRVHDIKEAKQSIMLFNKLNPENLKLP